MFTEFNIYIQLICITVFWVNVQNFNFFPKTLSFFSRSKSCIHIRFWNNFFSNLTQFIFLFSMLHNRILKTCLFIEPLASGTRQLYFSFMFALHWSKIPMCRYIYILLFIVFSLIVLTYSTQVVNVFVLSFTTQIMFVQYIFTRFNYKR